jgi:hypothetical protein
VRSAVAAAVLAAALAAALVLTRTIGGVVVIATVMVLVYDRRWTTLGVYVATVALLLLPWQLFVWKHAPGFVPELRGSYGPYLEWLVEGYREGGWPLLREVCSKNIGDVVFSVGTMVSPLVRGAVRQLLATLALGFLAWGALVALGRPATRVSALALGGYLALVAVWPYQVERFVWGVWPLVLLVAYHGARDLHFRVVTMPSRASLSVVALAGVLVAGHTIYNVRGFARGWASSASRGMAARLLPIVQYVADDVRLHGKVISTEASPLVALYTGEKVVPVEILLVRDHVRDKTLGERAAIIGAIDRRFRPDAYVLMTRGPYLPALLEASFDPGRRFFEISPQGLPVRAFKTPD